MNVRTSDGTPLGRDEADRELFRLQAEADRIAAALPALVCHVGHQLLEGARLTGLTARRWSELKARIAALRTDLSICQDTLGVARAIRGGLDPDLLAVLTRLLTGPAVELVERMSVSYAGLSTFLDETEAAWSALAVRLAEVEEVWRSAQSVAAGLEDDDHTSPGGPDRLDNPTSFNHLDSLGRELSGVRELVLHDPLALWRDGRADPACFDRIAVGLVTVWTDLERIAAGRAEAIGS